MRRRGAVLCFALGVLVLAGCGGEGDKAPTSAQTATQPSAPTPKSPPSKTSKATPASPDVPESHCPEGLPSCRATKGRIVFVERVDPDGDGDAHFVVVDAQSITLPGLTAIDVRKGLRPHPLPEIGDLISAAGPVQTGSHGQSQIHALEVHASE
jgi:hypothetical protein